MTQGIVFYDNGVTRVDLRARRPQSAKLIVVFNHAHSNDVEMPGWAEDFLWDAGFDVLSVKSRRNEWYQDLSLAEFSTQVMAKLEYEAVFSYSASMGAYAAAYFAGAIKAKRAILIAPQYSIDPEFVPWENRWTHLPSIDFKHQSLASVAYPDTEYVIVYDPWTLDRRHADDIAHAVGPRDVMRIKVYFGGHEPLCVIEETGLLPELLRALLDDPAAVPAVLDTFSRRRKDTWRYVHGLFFHALGQRRQIAYRALALELCRRSKRLSQRILSVRAMTAVEAWDLATGAIADLPDIQRGQSADVDSAINVIDGALAAYPSGEGAHVAEAWLRKVGPPLVA